MTDETFYEFTILTNGPLNGEKIHLRGSDIRRVLPVEINSDSQYIVGQTKKIKGSLLLLHAMSGPNSQTVQETPAEIMAACGPAIRVANLELRNQDIESKSAA